MDNLSLEMVKNIGKGEILVTTGSIFCLLNLSQTRNSRHFQTEKVCG